MNNKALKKDDSEFCFLLPPNLQTPGGGRGERVGLLERAPSRIWRKSQEKREKGEIRRFDYISRNKRKENNDLLDASSHPFEDKDKEKK